jgi:hypothetical protein
VFSPAAVNTLIAAAVGRMTRSTLRRWASSRTWSITGNAPSAPVPITSRRHRHGMASAVEAGCGRTYCGTSWRRPSCACGPSRDRLPQRPLTSAQVPLSDGVRGGGWLVGHGAQYDHDQGHRCVLSEPVQRGGIDPGGTPEVEPRARIGEGPQVVVEQAGEAGSASMPIERVSVMVTLRATPHPHSAMSSNVICRRHARPRSHEVTGCGKVGLRRTAPQPVSLSTTV